MAVVNRVINKLKIKDAAKEKKEEAKDINDLEILIPYICMVPPPLLPGHEIISKINMLLDDPTYVLPDNISEPDRNLIRTIIPTMAQNSSDALIQNARDRTFRSVPHGGRKSRNQKKRQSRRKQIQRQSRRRTRSFRR